MQSTQDALDQLCTAWSPYEVAATKSSNIVPKSSTRAPLDLPQRLSITTHNSSQHKASFIHSTDQNPLEAPILFNSTIMKIPSGFVDTNGKTAKGEIVLTTGPDQLVLQEFGTTTEGNKTTCYVLTASGDIPVMRFALNANIADHIDLVVDGVLRNSQSSTLSKTFKGFFEKVIYQGRKANNKRAAVKYSKMQVKERVSIKGIPSTNSKTPAAVSSFELRLYRIDTESSEEATPAVGETPVAGGAERPPAFDKCAEWYDCNSNLEFDGPLPPYQIDFFGHKDASKVNKDKVLKDLPENCKLWANFVFHLRSAADLQHLGFEYPAYTSAQSPLPASPNSRSGSKACKTERIKQESEATSSEAAGLEDHVTPREDSEGSEVQFIKTTPRSAPDLAPRTTLNGLLNVISNANGDEDVGADNLEDGSARGSMTPGAEKLDHGAAQELTPRFYSSQGLEFPNTAASLERVPILQCPESATSSAAAKDSRENVRPKTEPVDGRNTPRESREQGRTFLPGVTSVKTSPAHKAFVQRPATEESESSREATPTPIQNESFYAGGENFPRGGQNTPDVTSRRQGFSLPPEVLESIEVGKSGLLGRQGEAWKPSTPPVASLKRRMETSQRNPVGHDDIWGRQAIKVSDSFAQDSLRSIQSHDGRENAHYLLPETFQLLPLGSFKFVKPALPGFANQQGSFDSQASYGREPSEAPSDTDTEIADPEDIARAVRSSQRSTQTTNTSKVPPRAKPLNDQSAKSDSIEVEQGNHTIPSPVLGSRRLSNPRSDVGSPLSQSFVRHPGSLSDPINPTQNASQIPRSPVIPDLAMSRSAKFQPGSPHNSSSMQVIKQSDSQPPTPLKRKADAMTGDSVQDQGSPRKAFIAPAERKQKHENDKAAAEARIAAAQRKREELQKRLEAARDVKREMDKVKALNQKAADVERENAEMEAEIAAIYGVKENA